MQQSLPAPSLACSGGGPAGDSGASKEAPRFTILKVRAPLGRRRRQGQGVQIPDTRSCVATYFPPPAHLRVTTASVLDSRPYCPKRMAAGRERGRAQPQRGMAEPCAASGAPVSPPHCPRAHPSQCPAPSWSPRTSCRCTRAPRRPRERRRSSPRPLSCNGSTMGAWKNSRGALPLTS